MAEQANTSKTDIKQTDVQQIDINSEDQSTGTFPEDSDSEQFPYSDNDNDMDIENVNDNDNHYEYKSMEEENDGAPLPPQFKLQSEAQKKDEFLSIFNSDAEDDEDEFMKEMQKMQMSTPQGGGHKNKQNDDHQYEGYKNKSNNQNKYSKYSPSPKASSMNMNFKWQWDSGKQWKDYSMDDSQMIESQYGLVETAQIKIHGTVYNIDFSKLRQQNTKNGGVRKIRRVPIDHKDNSKQSDYGRNAKSTSKYSHNNNKSNKYNQVGRHDGYNPNKSNIQHSKKSYNDNDNEQGFFSKYFGDNEGGNGSNYGHKNNKYHEGDYNHNNNMKHYNKSPNKSKHNSYGSGGGGAVVWQCKLGQKWMDYEYGTSCFIESKFATNKEKFFQCSIRGKQYFVNLQEMTQINPQTGKTRPIRRGNGGNDVSSPKQYKRDPYQPHLNQKTKVKNNMNQQNHFSDDDNNNDNHHGPNMHGSEFGKHGQHKHPYNGNMNDDNDFSPNHNNMGHPNFGRDDDMKSNHSMSSGHSNHSNKYSNNYSPSHGNNQSHKPSPNKHGQNNNDNNFTIPGMGSGNNSNHGSGIRGKPHKWQWKADNGDYIDYDANDSFKMEHLYQNKGKEYRYKAPHNGQLYIIKFNELKQYNDKTRMSREIRRVPISTSSGSNDNNFRSGPTMKWQWYDDKNFCDYPKAISIGIEKSFNSNKKSHMFENPKSKSKYVIIFDTMKQKNTKTNKTRDIRRVRLSVKGAKPQRKPSQRTKYGWPDPKTWKGPKATHKRKVFGKQNGGKNIMKLYHITDAKAGDLIFKEHKMIRGGGGMFGGGIYFAETVQSAQYKAEHHGVLITALVYVGKEHVVQDASAGHFTFQDLQKMGCDSVYAPKGSGKGKAERVVYNFDQVCVIDKKPMPKK